MSAAGTLSGGNQQKVVVAREFEGELKLLVLDQPTRGLDVGSIEFIHNQAIARRDTGIAILLVSAELDEVLEMSDRIGVMFRGAARGGRWMGQPPTSEDVGLLMATGGRGGGVQPQTLEEALVTAAWLRQRSLWRRAWTSRCCRPSAIGLALIFGAVLMILSSPLIDGFDLFLPITAYKALLAGLRRLAELDRQHAGQCHAAGAGRPGGRHRLQGRPVQHRRPGPVPDGRPVAPRWLPSRSNDASPWVAIPVSIIAGMLGGMAWGFIPGFLKAFTRGA